jgi:hypothetical protein
MVGENVPEEMVIDRRARCEGHDCTDTWDVVSGGVNAGGHDVCVCPGGHFVIERHPDEKHTCSDVCSSIPPGSLRRLLDSMLAIPGNEMVHVIEDHPDDRWWRWTVKGVDNIQHSSHTVGLEVGGLIKAEHAAEALLWLIDQGPMWDGLDIDEEFSIKMTPLDGAVGESNGCGACSA